MMIINHFKPRAEDFFVRVVQDKIKF
ncbi:hypothetical protein NC652_001581 [Populus alba x Populus x berolinensis]|nr:hypothetical protein NC652_001581 [Populus alba x Populus x berolinensis]